MQALRRLELYECPMPLLETLTTLHPNLEVMKIVIGISESTTLDLGFVSRMPKLYELKLNGFESRELQGFEEFLSSLNLKHLYLLGFEGVHNVPRYEWSKNTTLETLALEEYFNPSQLVPFLKSLTALKKLCLHFFEKWDSFEILKCISEMNSINCLELFHVEVGPNFENGLKLCSNLKELTIRPSNDSDDDDDDERVLINAKALEPLKNTLKKFKWCQSLSKVNTYSFLREMKTVLPFTEISTTNQWSPDIFD